MPRLRAEMRAGHVSRARAGHPGLACRGRPVVRGTSLIRIRVLAALAVVALVAAACGGSDDGADRDEATDPAATPTTAAPTTEAPTTTTPTTTAAPTPTTTTAAPTPTTTTAAPTPTTTTAAPTPTTTTAAPTPTTTTAAPTPTTTTAAPTPTTTTAAPTPTTTTAVNQASYMAPGKDHTIQIYNDNIVVLPISEDFIDGLTVVALPLADHTTRFYEYFEDEFDFLFIVTNLIYTVDMQVVYSGAHISVQNDVQGIGEPLFTDTDTWGSSGRLQTVLDFPHTGRDGSLWTPIGSGPGLHEVMHKWANFLVPTADDAHWGFSSANGLLGGFDIMLLEDHGNGRYTAGSFNTNGSQRRPLSPIELYLAGLAPPEEVPDLWVAEDGEWLLDSEGNRQLAPNGYPLFSASGFRTITIEEIIAEHGQRIPDVDQSQKEFRAAVILLVNEDHPANSRVLEKLSEEVSWVSVPAFTDQGDRTVGNSLRSTNFYESTDGRATITMDGLSVFLRDSVFPINDE